MKLSFVSYLEFILVILLAVIDFQLKFNAATSRLKNKAHILKLKDNGENIKSAFLTSDYFFFTLTAFFSYVIFDTKSLYLYFCKNYMTRFYVLVDWFRFLEQNVFRWSKNI